MIRMIVLIVFVIGLATVLYAVLRSVWMLWRGDEELVPGGSYGRQFTRRRRRRGR
jgi:hypothetical protein